MKIKKIFPLAAILLLSAAFSFTSCKKDKIEQFKLTLTVGNGGTVQAYSNEERTTPIPNLLAIDKDTKVYLKAEPATNAVVDTWTGIDGNPIDAAKTLAIATMNGNRTVTVKFTVSQTVTFDTNGGSTVASITTNPGATITKPANPTKTGYAFVNWYKEAALLTLWNFDTDLVGQQSVTLYAKWTDQFYTITLNANGGNADLIASVDVAHNGTQDPAAMPAGTEPNRPGYVFAGWYKEAAAATPWTATETVTANMTLYAKWIAVRTITFNSNGGSAIANLSVKEGDLITKPTDPTKTGYTFDYWSKNTGLTSEWLFGTDKVADVNMTLYAKWTANTYTVEYHGGNDGATGTTATSNHTYDTEKSLTANGFSLTGHGFYKWATTLGGDAVYIDRQSVENLTATPNAVFHLYALWNVDSYLVTFDANKPADATDEVTGLPAVIGTNYNALVTPPTAPTTLTGYQFIGWYKESELSTEWNFSTDKMPANGITLYAKWAKLYDLNLSYNDGNATFTPLSYPEGVSTTLPTPTTRTDYTFLTWNTKPDGTGDDYTEYTITSAGATLYAKWTYTGDYTVGDYYPDPNVEYSFGFGDGVIVTSGTPAIGIVFTTTGTRGTMIALKPGSDGSPVKYVDISIPDGWKLPTIEEFETLYKLYNGELYNNTASPDDTGWGNTPEEQASRATFNNQITTAGGTALSPDNGSGDELYHWSSTIGSGGTGFKIFSLNQGKQDEVTTAPNISRRVRVVKDF